MPFTVSVHGEPCPAADSALSSLVYMPLYPGCALVACEKDGRANRRSVEYYVVSAKVDVATGHGMPCPCDGTCHA